MQEHEVLQFGSDFADFRGLVISSPIEFGSGAKCFFAPPEGTKPQDEGVPPPPSAPLPLSSKKWLAKLRCLWPFLMTPPAEAVNPRQHEFTVSRLLGGRALLATTLALDLQESARSALHYLIYTNGTSPWETGRMLNTLAHTGTFRLAALLNMGKMRRLVPRLAVCEARVRTALDALTKKFDDNPEPQPDDKYEQRISAVKRRADILARCLPEIGKSLNAITEEFSQEDKLHQADNFERRIALSRLYANRFRQLVERLRIGRLEGFVPYDEFVERKLGGAYALIDLISTRFERIKADITALRQIETSQRSRISEENVGNIQRWADWALFLVLVPYYAGEVIIEKMGGADRNAWWAWLSIWLLSATIGTHTGRNILRRIAYSAQNQKAYPTRNNIEPVTEF
jgi:hypothetical protein